MDRDELNERYDRDFNQEVQRRQQRIHAFFMEFPWLRRYINPSHVQRTKVYPLDLERLRRQRKEKPGLFGLELPEYETLAFIADDGSEIQNLPAVVFPEGVSRWKYWKAIPINSAYDAFMRLRSEDALRIRYLLSEFQGLVLIHRVAKKHKDFLAWLDEAHEKERMAEQAAIEYQRENLLREISEADAEHEETLGERIAKLNKPN